MGVTRFTPVLTYVTALWPSEKLLCAMSDVDVQSTYDEVLLTYMMYQVYTSDFKLSHMMYVLTHYAWSLYINVRFCARNYVRSCDVCYYRTLMYVKLTLAMYEFRFSKLYDKHTLMYVNTSTKCPFFSNLGDVSRFTHVFVRHKLPYLFSRSFIAQSGENTTKENSILVRLIYDTNIFAPRGTPHQLYVRKYSM